MYGPSIQNLIFDVGGVILNLDTSKTHEALAQLAGLKAVNIKTNLETTSFFNDYEKGLLPDEEFREHLRKLLKVTVTDDQLDQAWNAMLGSIPKERLQLLEKLKEKHRIFLLSNTNNIHLQSLNMIVLEASGKPSLDHYFHKAYYSHLMKMRKPDAEIFEQVLSENELTPAHTLFLDDNVDNLRGAEKTGILTAHVSHPDMIFSILA